MSIEYSYFCSNCNKTFEKRMLISERFEPIYNPCPLCGESDHISLVVNQRKVMSNIELLKSFSKNQAVKHTHEELNLE